MNSDYEADNVHVWIGSNHESESDYLQHFSLDYSTDGDFYDLSYKICDFCKMLNLKWYDEDFIGIIPRKEHDIFIDSLLEEVAVDYNEMGSVKDICHKLGIDKANSVLWYSGSDIKKLAIGYDFFGLKYIGCFKGD
ncbi:immunity 22 family protein [Pluralibacter gergoviae]|uniref:immunity 22 family protein n=1 Tax=Pluralibacter gergoviae TaxID=61647 RepID=UPI0004F8214A|nr:immunity 22 family protein [Pluralibacter gergoviae]AIQ99448.1 hypothetical protein LG71_05800 [Pluralibacter gergoviae]EKZ9514548.1 immunity 22 family protein [Pluralibacter gergoviae]ELC3019140.1 immunity 22 family protein [Pluralibacter gergoviae]ELC3021624.1 immunity 22 family protein [Pluralibacter gergoviae]KMK17100.1 hypothetical protein ABW09_17970 [Pluralibacter gergoviae]